MKSSSSSFPPFTFWILKQILFLVPCRQVFLIIFLQGFLTKLCREQLQPFPFHQMRTRWCSPMRNLLEQTMIFSRLLRVTKPFLRGRKKLYKHFAQNIKKVGKGRWWGKERKKKNYRKENELISRTRNHPVWCTPGIFLTLTLSLVCDIY